MRGISSKKGWVLGRGDWVNVALLIVAVVAALWSLVAGFGQSVAWIVAAAAGLAGALRLQRKSVEANNRRPLLHGSVSGDSGKRCRSYAPRVLLPVVGRADSPLQPLLVAAVFAAVVGALGSTLIAGLSVLDPAQEMHLSDMIAETGYSTLALAAVSGVAVGAAVVIVTGTTAIRRLAHPASSPATEPPTATVQAHAARPARRHSVSDATGSSSPRVSLHHQVPMS